MPRRGPVRRTVPDIAGRLVATLLDGVVRDAGEHAVVGDGRDARGGLAAAGVYFARLEWNWERRAVKLARVPRR